MSISISEMSIVMIGVMKTVLVVALRYFQLVVVVLYSVPECTLSIIPLVRRNLSMHIRTVLVHTTAVVYNLFFELGVVAGRYVPV
jgi:hypothetical protein